MIGKTVGFQSWRDPRQAELLNRGATMFIVDEEYSRQLDIHKIYGGQEQSGIVTPSGYPFIFILTGDTARNYG